jgi:HAD superfamily hydrolase (TIGR01509 family)
VYSAGEVAAIHAAWVTGDYEDVAGVVGAVREAGLVTALLSNTNAAHFAELAGGPAVRLLDHQILSYEIGLLKPDAAIYAHVEERTGVPAEAIGFFDDTAANVAAARARGWQAERIDPELPTAPQMLEALRRWQVC